MSETGNLVRNRLGGFGDYLFGRNAAIGMASLMLLTLSGYATWSGMHDFIVGFSNTSTVAERGLPGGLAFSTSALVVAVVIALTFLMWLSLRETFRARQSLLTRSITFPLYLFLALWSVGFGYGFWWSLIAGEEATRTSMANLQDDARDAATVIAARLDAVKVQLDSVVAWSDGQMAREEKSGGSCGIRSARGRGPLYNARSGVRDSIANLRNGIVDGWITPVQADVTKLETMAETLTGNTFEERQLSFERRAREIRTTAKAIAARSNAFGKSTADEMRALADAVDVKPRNRGFSCYDPTLAQRLRQAADQAERPAVIKLREAAFTEGPAGVANAVKALWSNLGSYGRAIIGYILSGGKDPGTSTSTGIPITGRDLIALLATLGIDLGLFVLTALNPPLVPASRTDGLQAPVSKLRLPSGAVVRQLAAAISTAVARAPGADLEWVRRHFVHHGGASYFVIPNLYSCDENKEEELKALAMNQLAGVFDDVDLVRVLTEAEFEEFGKEEERRSFTDLDRYRSGYEESALDTNSEMSEGFRRQPIRNHGLLSKAQRTLGIAGWSEKARRDVEIYRLVDVEGLTPLLTLLNEATIEKGAKAAEAAIEQESAEQDLGATPTLTGPRQPSKVSDAASSSSPDKASKKAPSSPDTIDLLEDAGTEVDPDKL